MSEQSSSVSNKKEEAADDNAEKSQTAQKSGVETSEKKDAEKSVTGEKSTTEKPAEQNGEKESPSLEQQQPSADKDEQQQGVEGKSSKKSLESESQKDVNDEADEAEGGADEQEAAGGKQDKSTQKEKKTSGSSQGSKPGSGAKRRKGEKVTKQNCRIGFIGAGKMTEMIVKGLIEHSSVPAKQIYIASKTGKNHDHFKQLGCTVTKRNYDIFGKMDCDVVFLCIHGNAIRQCYAHGGLRPMALTTNFIPNQRHPLYILSLIGGVTLNDIKKTLLNPDHPDKYQLEMHRIMLNHSVGYGQGYGSLDVDLDSKYCAQIIRELLTPIARFDFTPENQMDIACALAGCGSAFCYYFLTAISDGAFKKGLNKLKATKIAADALRSASVSLLVSGKNPSDLRDTFASPSGPAIYGIHVLDKDDFPSGISSAVEAAYKRIKELTENPSS
ncbi:pyrroline-5-carboxylate reductase 3 isoform X1 [Dermatophagoides farinae]|uniref:pyrroline-5-carboxylate reductase 3 isoform X1 n=1 Tax=Dermatophagoides farinae TaxID=6954 RepID=UPI003F5DC7C6